MTNIFRPPELLKNILETEYIKNNLSLREIETKYKIPYRTLWDNLNRFNIDKREPNHILNLKNQTFNNLTPRTKSHRDIHGNWYWKCDCKCGNTCLVKATEIKNGHIMSCGCLQNPTKENHYSWKGHGEISGTYFSNIKNRCKRFNLDFDLTIEYIWIIFLKQNRKCILSGIILQFGSSYTQETTASLDRIDSNKGYIKENVQWVHKDINRIKSDIPENIFINYCKLIAQNQENIPCIWEEISNANT